MDKKLLDFNWSKEDTPRELLNLSDDQQQKIIDWCEDNIYWRKTYNMEISSYKLKHFCEHDVGFYVSNGQLKGAMLMAGFLPKNRLDKNWFFKIQTLKRTDWY